MKTLVAFLLANLAAVPALAETGTINFANAGPGFHAPIRFANGAPASGAGWRATLLVRSESGFMPQATVLLESGELAGLFFGGRIDLAGTQPLQPVELKVRIEQGSEVIAVSDPFQVVPGGGVFPPANLANMPSITVPTPALSIRQDEAGPLVAWPKEYLRAGLEAADSLPGEWQAFSGALATNGTSVFLPVNENRKQKFFRLKLP